MAQNLPTPSPAPGGWVRPKGSTSWHRFASLLARSACDKWELSLQEVERVQLRPPAEVQALGGVRCRACVVATEGKG